jgi:hypothetical protein
MLCFPHDGIKEIEIDPIGSDLYICQDGAQYVVGYTNSDNGTYFIKHNKSDKKRNEMLDRIMMPDKWAEKDKVVVTKPKELEKVMKPATAMVEEMKDRGL